MEKSENFDVLYFVKNLMFKIHLQNIEIFIFFFKNVKFHSKLLIFQSFIII